MLICGTLAFSSSFCSHHLTFKHLELPVQVLVKREHGRHIPTPVAVIRCGPDGDQRAFGKVIFETCRQGKRNDEGTRGETLEGNEYQRMLKTFYDLSWTGPRDLRSRSTSPKT